MKAKKARSRKKVQCTLTSIPESRPILKAPPVQSLQFVVRIRQSRAYHRGVARTWQGRESPVCSVSLFDAIFARRLRTAREANSGERSLRPQVGVGVVGVGHEVRSAYIQLRRFLYKPDPRLGYSRIARCAIRDRKRSAATGPPDSIIHLHDTSITRFPSLCSALEESPG
jgi:hypothetical protein